MVQEGRLGLRTPRTNFPGGNPASSTKMNEDRRKGAWRPMRLRNTVPSSQGGETPAVSLHAGALYSSHLQQDGGGQVAKGRSVAAGNPAAARGSCGRRPGNSGPRSVRCCSREALLDAGEEGARGVAFPGHQCPLCTPLWARVRRPLRPLRYHSQLWGSGAPTEAEAVSRR